MAKLSETLLATAVKDMSERMVRSAQVLGELEDERRTIGEDLARARHLMERMLDITEGHETEDDELLAREVRRFLGRAEPRPQAE